jgi:hypothetical protein
MIDAAICDGEIVTVRRQESADHGDIVAALLEDEATVKVLRRHDGRVWLMPRNPAYQPIPGDQAQILGKVVGVLRLLCTGPACSDAERGTDGPIAPGHRDRAVVARRGTHVQHARPARRGRGVHRPAEDLFRRAAERGWTVDTSQPEYPVIPGVSLGFTRQTSQEVERDADGLPRHVTSVLVGGKEYYNYR